MNRCLLLFLWAWFGFGFEASACTVPVFRFALDRWQGAHDPAIATPPLYEEIARRVISGDSAVFVQVDSGNTHADDALYAKLTKRLTFFQTVAQLPEIDPNDPSSQLGPGPPLELRFSTLRIPRDHPQAREMAGPKAEAMPADEAWIIPVFGRGRAIGSWPASVLDEEGIDEICHFLTGACSCQVKVQNPGWDLVMNIDWDQRLQEASEKAETAEGIEEKPPAPSAQTEAPAVSEVTFTDSNTVEQGIKVPVLPLAGAALLLIAALVLLRKK